MNKKRFEETELKNKIIFFIELQSKKGTSENFYKYMFNLLCSTEEKIKIVRNKNKIFLTGSKRLREYFSKTENKTNRFEF